MRKVLNVAGHYASGFAGGALLPFGIWIPAAALLVYQAVGYWQKQDRVSKDLREVITGIFLGAVIALGVSHL